MKELEEIKSRMVDIQTSLNELYTMQQKVEKEYEVARESLLLKEDSLLQENIWTLGINIESFNLYLTDENRIGPHNEGFEGLRKLYEDDYHCRHYILDKYVLIFNDGEMQINSDTNADLITFIKEYNLKIVHNLGKKVTNIDKEMSKLQGVKDTINNLLLKI